MKLLVIGINHRGSSRLLAAASAGMTDVPSTLRAVMGSPDVGEAVVVSTCNRVEIYAAVDTFHGALNDLGAVFAHRAAIPLGELAPDLYAYYDDDAVRHLFTVVSGLDSLVVGEPQVLGQVRAAYTRATELGTTGAVLHDVMQRALRAGKRVHSRALVNQPTPSMVDIALDLGATHVGSVAGKRALVLGAGQMGALAARVLRARGVAELRILSRSAPRAQDVAQPVDAAAGTLEQLDEALPGVDVVVCATTSPDVVLSLSSVAPRVAGNRPLLVVDLAMPRDTDPALTDEPTVRVIDLAALAAQSPATKAPFPAALITARRILSEELAGFTAKHRAAQVTPTIVALRSRAEALIERELVALDARRPELDVTLRADTERAMRRVVNALLHDPTVRVKELAASGDGTRYATALAELFDLNDDPIHLGYGHE